MLAVAMHLTARPAEIPARLDKTLAWTPEVPFAH
jgi:hypothetical protein